MSNLYVYSQGSIINFKDNRLQVKDTEDCLTSIPIESIDNVLLFGGVGITTPCIHELLKRGIHMTWLSKSGRYYGRMESTQFVNIHRQRLQFRKSDENQFRLDISKAFISGKTSNQKTILSRYQRKHEVNDLDPIVDKINCICDKISQAKSIEELIGYEGIIAKYYYEGLNLILPKEYRFKGRSKRPPKDAFNSVISFGYTLLLYEIFTSVINTGLNPYAAFLHRDKLNHPALCSDLMEEWRPILVDSLAIALFNNQDFIETHFVTNDRDEGVYLNNEGVKVFVFEFEKRLRQEVKYLTDVGYKMSFRRIIEHQVQQLINSIEKDDAKMYTPVIIR